MLAELDGVDATSPDEAARAVLARALFEKARALSRLGRGAESQRAVADLVSRLEHDPQRDVRRRVCRALFGRAKDRLAEPNADRRAVLVDYRHVLHIADRAPPDDAVAAEALYHLALTHRKIGVERASDDHLEKASLRFQEIERRFGASDDPEIARWVARAAMNDALIHPLDAAGPMYETAFARHQGAREPELRALAADALLKWAARCLLEGRTEDAIALAERVLATFPASGEREGGPVGEGERERERERANADDAIRSRRASAEELLREARSA